MKAPLFPQENGAVHAQELLATWRRECADLPAVQALTPTTETSLLTFLEHILSDTGDVNVDHQDIWEVLVHATALQLGEGVSKGPNRAGSAGEQLWANSFILGDAALPARRVLLAIQSGTDAELEMDELTYLVENIVHKTSEQAEVVFGHGCNPVLGESIQVLMLVSRS